MLRCLNSTVASSSTKGLPSWVCDWSANPYDPFGDSTHIDKPFHASGNSTANLRFPDYPQEEVPRIEGFHVGEITETGFPPTVKLVQRYDGSAVKWLVVEEFVSRGEQVFNHLHGLSEEDIARTLIEDYQVFGIGEGRITARHGRATSSCVRDYLKFKEWLTMAKEHMAIEQAKLEQASVPEYTDELKQRVRDFDLALRQHLALASTGAFWSALNMSLDRRPFYLREGYIGLSPRETSADDIVCIFLGRDLPFVLRLVGGGRWRLLGEAYVHKPWVASLWTKSRRWKCSIYVDPILYQRQALRYVPASLSCPQANELQT